MTRSIEEVAADMRDLLYGLAQDGTMGFFSRDLCKNLVAEYDAVKPDANFEVSFAGDGKPAIRMSSEDAAYYAMRTEQFVQRAKDNDDQT